MSFGLPPVGGIGTSFKILIYFESDTPFQTGTRVRFDIEKSTIDLDTDPNSGEVKWCAEISAAVVLYDYGVGVEFDPKMKQTVGSGKPRVVAGDADRTGS